MGPWLQPQHHLDRESRTGDWLLPRLGVEPNGPGHVVRADYAERRRGHRGDFLLAALDVAVPAAADWRIRVYYYDAGGATIAQDLSDADFTVTGNTPIVTFPNGGEIFTPGSNVGVTWTVPAGNTAGYFRVWAWSPTVAFNWYELTTTSGIAATGATTYTLPWAVAVTAGY